MQIEHNLLNKNTTANRVSSRGNPVNLSLQPSLHFCKAPFGDRTNKNSIVNRGSLICVRTRNPADCHHLFVWFCLWDSNLFSSFDFQEGLLDNPVHLLDGTCSQQRVLEYKTFVGEPNSTIYPFHVKVGWLNKQKRHACMLWYLNEKTVLFLLYSGLKSALPVRLHLDQGKGLEGP